VGDAAVPRTSTENPEVVVAAPVTAKEPKPDGLIRRRPEALFVSFEHFAQQLSKLSCPGIH